MSASNEKRNRLLKQIREALIGIRREIQKAERGEESLDGLQQLIFIESKLAEMEQALDREDWSAAERTKPGMARLVVDTWPMQDALGTLITEIEYEYERLK
ncbi:MAG: hypothetical protein HY735_06145 [Verrucomicrobia bacterium]|nr:hypothetical protein [Verrucomicrobiota bacterium]